MFREFLHIVFALFLFLVSMGVTISMHYCGDQLVSTALYSKADSCCSGDDDCGCCHDKSIHIEVKDRYVAPVSIEANAPISIDVLFPVLFQLFDEEIISVTKTTYLIYDLSSLPPLSTRLAIIQSFLC